MSTRQKLTLGIAAIFMVTLTIVGVTYAYFVTQVTTGTEAAVDVTTANVGEVEYQVGNGTNDVITLTDVLPGTTMYKTFKVHNSSSDATSSSQYNIFITSTPTANTPQFIHATDDSGCYVSTVKPSNDAAATATCFDGEAYNNVKVSLYQVDQTTFESVADDGKSMTGTLGTAYSELRKGEDGQDETYTVENVLVAAVAGVDASSATQNLTEAGITIAGGTAEAVNTHYYVLKVEYVDAKANQNIENNAALTLKVSIK